VRLARDAGEGVISSIAIELYVGGDLDAEQIARLHEIAGRCPVHRTLMQGVQIIHR
jgi:uncharacterized OsmC-like protein